MIWLLACVCTWADRVVPPDGASNVGTNATIVVLGEHQTVALQNDAGLDIPVTGMTLAAQPGDVWTPFARLGAGQDFHVVVDGQVLSTFTTGPSADLEPPSQSGITAVTAVQADIAGCDDCTPQFLALSTVGTPAPDVDYFEIGIGSSVFTVLPEQIGTLYAMSGGECALPLPHLVPGAAVEVTQQIPHRNRVWTEKVRGTVVAFEQRPTGSWFAHSRDDKLWLDRLVLKREDGEILTLILDKYSHVELK